MAQNSWWYPTVWGDPDGASMENGLQREQDLKFEGGAGQHGQGARPLGV